MGQFNLNVKRISIADDNVYFPHRGNEEYVPIQYCALLDRNIVTVKSVCWLEFGYTFKDVAPGKYSLSFRMRIEKNFCWPHMDDESTEIGLVTPEESSTWWQYKDWWFDMAEGTKPVEPFDDHMICVTWKDLGSDIIPKKSSWITVTLPEFSTEQIGDITFLSNSRTLSVIGGKKEFLLIS